MLIWRCLFCLAEWAEPPEDLDRAYCPVKHAHPLGWHRKRHVPLQVIVALPDDPGALLEGR